MFKEAFNWIKQKLKALWLRFKSWVVGIFAILGLVVIASAAPVNFSWQNATEREDGSTFDPATEQAEIRIYCDGDTSPTFSSPGALENFVGNLSFGTHTCYGTTFDTFGLESIPSNTKTYVVTPARPNPPVLD